MPRLALAWLVISGCVLARLDGVRYLRWSDVQPFLSSLAANQEKLPEFSDTEEWDTWIRQRDAAIRGRIDRGIEDSISALIVFGTSFVAPPRLVTAPDAVNSAGGLTAGARARMDAFIQAIDQLDDERFRLVLDFLRRRRVTEDELPAFLAGNLRRFALEAASLQKVHTQGSARSEAGLPAETSLLINFAIEDTLGADKANGAVPAHIQRIAIIGPGLDLAGEPGVYDACPPQSLQPFAVLEAVLRLALAQPSQVQVTSIDLNPFVLSHLKTALSKVRGGQGYLIQLPRPSSAGWNAAAVAYWQRFGDTIATPATPLTPPPGIELRAVGVKAQFAARISVEDLDIVAQTFETAPGFDLVVATNVFAYYGRLEQQLALANIARMMSSGGILLSNGLAPGGRLAEFEDLGVHHVAYTESAGNGADLLTYRRR